MSAFTTAGTTIGICAATPASFNVAGYDALTFVTVGEITNFGEFGRVYNIIKHNPVASRATVKIAGSYDEGQMNLQLALDTDDAGQIAMKAGQGLKRFFKVTTPTGDIFYFPAIIASWKMSLGSVDQVMAAMASLDITSETLAGVGIVEKLA